MSEELCGSPEEVIAEVQSIFRGVVPEAVCELQDYQFRIGCGTVDAAGQIQQVIFIRKHLTREQAKAGAFELKRKLEVAEKGKLTDR